MKGSDYTTQLLELNNRLTREENQHNEVAAQLSRTTSELLATRRVLLAWERARALVISKYPDLQEVVDWALREALAEQEAEREK